MHNGTHYYCMIIFMRSLFLYFLLFLFDWINSISQYRKSIHRGLKILSMARKTVDSYYCDQCGMEHIKWVGRCTSCKEWNTIKTIKYAKNINSLPPLDKRSIRHDIGLNEPFGESSHSQTVSSSWLVESSPLLQMNEINCVESVQR